MALPRNIRRVENNYNGCFVACYGMLLGLDYDAAFARVHPGRSIYDSRGGGLSPAEAIDALKAAGLQPRIVEIDSVRKLRQTALIWLRWDIGSPLMHSVVYEAKTGFFWDPNSWKPLSNYGIGNLNRLKENVVVLDNYNPPAGREPGSYSAEPIPTPSAAATRITSRLFDPIVGCNCSACSRSAYNW